MGDTAHTFIEAAPGNHSSTTQATSCLTVQISNSLRQNGNLFNFIDTPGLNESIERDMSHMTSLYKTIQNIGEINAIVLVIPYNFKLDIQWVHTVSFFRDAFFPLFTRGHACIALTHMGSEDYDKAEELDGGFKAVKDKVLAECNQMLGLSCQSPPG